METKRVWLFGLFQHEIQDVISSHYIFFPQVFVSAHIQIQVPDPHHRVDSNVHLLF